jgi:hypothetical protein
VRLDEVTTRMNLHVPSIAAAVLILAGAAVCAQPRAEPPDPSCEPQALSAGVLRIDAWSCTLPTGRWEVRAEPELPGFALWVGSVRRETVVHAIPRAPGAPMSSIIGTLAQAGLIAQDHCLFVRTRSAAAPRGTRAYEIRPTGPRLEALRATPRDQIPEPPCGEYGWSTHGVRMFVVDPKRPRWVVYLNLGQDGTLIDPATLQIGIDGDAPAAYRTCPGLPVHLRGGTESEREAVCQGGADAIAFFAENGLPAPERIDVEIGAPLPEAIAQRAVGCYDPSLRRVLLVDAAHLQRLETWFDVPVVAATYRALAIHEIAHAIAACHFTIPNPSHRAHEFIAYTATFERMDPDLRSRILARYPDDGTEEAWLSELLHAMAPTRFGVNAWRLWRRPENGPRLVQRVLAGDALHGDMPPW